MAEPNIKKFAANRSNKQRQLVGTGVTVSVQFTNVQLGIALKIDFDTADRQLQFLQVNAPGMLGDKKVSAVIAALNKVMDNRVDEIRTEAGRFDAVAKARGIRMVQSKARSMEVNLHSPLSRKLLTLFETADEATSLLEALWVAGIAGDEDYRAKGKEWRSICHETVRDVGKIYSRMRAEANSQQEAA